MVSTPLPTPMTTLTPTSAPLATSVVGDGKSAAGVLRLTEAEVLTHLVRIVSDRTGYPEEMLAPDANIEADLGIDSIKRMEILAAFQETHGGGASDSFQQSLERLTAMKTLRESAATIVEIFATPAVEAAV
jgi:acyl carrier protein